MHGTIPTLCLERGFGLLQDPEGVELFSHHSALPSPDRCTTLAVRMVVEFEAEPGPIGPCATAITIMPEPQC
jgi:cold shock CspA family protein